MLKKKNSAHSTVLLFALVMSGCASSGVAPMDHGIYLVSARHSQIGFGAPVGAEADVYKEAAAFCMRSNREVETVKLETQDSAFARPGSAALQFRCIQRAGSVLGGQR